ncbi:MAG: DnaJ C-terminal domain-containing protein, partial [Pseudomonadota bacterium]
DVDISYPLAALGGMVTVPVLRGEEEIEVKPGTQPDETKVIHGAGVPFVNGHGRGNQIIRFKIQVPTKISPRAEELLKELVNELGDEISPRRGLFDRFQRSKNKKK